MLEALQFVKGVISRESKVNPVLNHYRIEGGRITGVNDTFAISAPIATDIEATPKGPDFAKAIERCSGKTISLFMEAEKLVVKSGRLTVRIDCTTEPFPLMQPEGRSFWLHPNFVEYSKALIPFINKDNAKAWARGILMDGPALTVTDNISLVQAYIGPEFAPPLPCVVPEAALRELARIKEKPTYATVSVRTITFYFEGDKWLCSRLMPNDWPTLTKLFEQPQEMAALTEDFWESVEAIQDFTDDRDTLIFDPGLMRTHLSATKAGASIDGEFPATKGAICCKFLLRLKPLIHSLAFDSWPAPMQFRGDYVRGVIAGMIRNDNT